MNNKNVKSLNKVFQSEGGLLSIYVTAGYPKKEDTISIIRHLDKLGVDFIEIGMPYSDPLADGPTIQHSSKIAIDNGMTMPLLFEQVKEARQDASIPMIYMGYWNQIMQYGVERFCQSCNDAGIESTIIPDLPMDIYEEEYAALFQKYNLGISFLISPQSEDDRIMKAAQLSTHFLYQVSSNAITGSKSDISQAQEAYFQRINNLQLDIPQMIGFGISDKSTFDAACRYATGAIIGSAFIKILALPGNQIDNITTFIQNIRS